MLVLFRRNVRLIKSRKTMFVSSVTDGFNYFDCYFCVLSLLAFRDLSL
jgi:hypothetical protein